VGLPHPSEFPTEPVARYRLTSSPYAVSTTLGCSRFSVPWAGVKSTHKPSPGLRTPFRVPTRCTLPGEPSDSHEVLALFGATQPEESTIPEGSHPSVRSAYRVLRPPDGFLLLEPTRPYFMPSAPMRFTLRGFSPLASRTPLGASAPLPLKQPTYASEEPKLDTQAQLPLDSEALLTPEVRTLCYRCYPAPGPMPPWASAPLRLSPPRSKPCG